MNEIAVFASAPAAAAVPPMLKAPRIVFPDGSASGNGPAGPAGPAAPGEPADPAGPAGICPALKSPASSEPFLTLSEVTASFFNCAVPTLLAGSLIAA